MPRPIYVVANWKMQSLPSESRRLAMSVIAIPGHARVHRIVCPPFLSLPGVHAVIAGSTVELGAQNIHWERAGPYTGEISASMVAEYASWCLIGHSERRRDQYETDSIIGQKLVRCLETGLRPILFVGETAAERERGQTDTVVGHQLETALVELARLQSPLPPLVLAYEPVWAIGFDKSPTADHAAAVARSLRATLHGLGLAPSGAPIAVLYGGSVVARNAGAFLEHPDLDGVVVGRASLDGTEMDSIIAQASAVALASDSTS